ncbi:hypothetical protein [Minwuia sp.]|uniref:hypothetical protein n=1 Tax=Minwuia sp. TaxID=2493630 RepID=UPI003A901410
MDDANDPRPGVLAIWHACRESRLAAFEHWYQTEHLAERLAVPGFLRGRRYGAADSRTRFFTCYEVDSPDVLFSEAYLARVNAPTEQTRQIMATAFTEMNRTVCRTVWQSGRMSGAWAVTCKGAVADRLVAQARALGADDGIARIAVWQRAAEGDGTGSVEQDIRGRDAQIDACLCVETLRIEDAERVARALTPGEMTAEPPEIFRLLCELTA